MKQERVQRRRTGRSSRTTRDNEQTPATDRREIRKDVQRVWFPEA